MSDQQDKGNDPSGPRDDGPRGGPPPGTGFRMSRGLGIWAFLLALFVVLIVLVKNNSEQTRPKTMNDFQLHLSDSEVERVVIKDTSLVFSLKNTDGEPGGSNKFRVEWPPQAIEGVVNMILNAPNAPECISDQDDNLVLQILVAMLPWLLIFVVIYFFVFRQLRNTASGGGILGNFGRSKHRVSSKEHTNIGLGDVAGVDEAKDEVQEIIEFLRNPKKFQRLGGRIPRGVLLVGEPGCGKTLLAKAIAGEADVPFFSISGSDFVEMFVGVGASRVRDLFKQAKDNSPCIIFLDEIDAVGRRRGSGFNGGGHDEREQTLNAILVEMDGFDTSDQVILIAATNRRDVLDPALTRPGRFDREVYVPLPDVKGRFEILKVHAKQVKMGPDIDLHRLARGTPMFSGADLAAIINEAALLATLGGKEHVEMDDLEEARDKVRWGRAKRSRVVDENEKAVTAYHEAGHALLQCLLEDADPLHKVSIIPRGPAGGATFSLPEKDRLIYGARYCAAQIKLCLGGRIAEELVFDEASSGAASDIQHATYLARKMVVDWGMSEKIGMVRHGTEPVQGFLGEMMPGKDYSDRTAQLIDDEIRRIIDTSYQQAAEMIKTNRPILEGIAQALLKYETLDAPDVERIVRGEELDKPTIADLIEAEELKRAPKARPATPPSTSGPNVDDGALPLPG